MGAAVPPTSRLLPLRSSSGAAEPACCVCSDRSRAVSPLVLGAVSSNVQATLGFQIQAGDDCHASSACALSLTPHPALQGLHLLQNGQSGQPDRQPRPAADAGCGKILQQRC